MHAADTNVLVRLIVRDDARQVRAAEAFVAKGVWISHLVLAEITWVLESGYDCSSEQIGNAIDMFLNQDQVSVQDRDVVAAALALFRKRPAVSFADCLILEIARKAGHLPLGTFDRSFAKHEDVERL